jgi:hypothetical protein
VVAAAAGRDCPRLSPHTQQAQDLRARAAGYRPQHQCSLTAIRWHRDRRSPDRSWALRQSG